MGLLRWEVAAAAAVAWHALSKAVASAAATPVCSAANSPSRGTVQRVSAAWTTPRRSSTSAFTRFSCGSSPRAALSPARPTQPQLHGYCDQHSPANLLCSPHTGPPKTCELVCLLAIGCGCKEIEGVATLPCGCTRTGCLLSALAVDFCSGQCKHAQQSAGAACTGGCGDEGGPPAQRACHALWQGAAQAIQKLSGRWLIPCTSSFGTCSTHHAFIAV